MTYASTLGDLPQTEDREELKGWAYEHMLAALDEHADEEMRRGVTLWDRIATRLSLPWRVDPPVLCQPRAARTLVLAWKVAEVAVARDILGTAPLLLLDDVMSELDGERRGAFLRLIGDDIQTVITTTNLGYFTDDLLDRAKVVSMGETC